MSSDGQGKRQRSHAGDAGGNKRKYFQSHTKATIPLQSRGFLISCVNGKERHAAQEATALLEEYLEQSPHGLPVQEHSISKDFSKLIQDEVSDLKARKGKLFEWHKTNVNGLLYLSLASEAEAVSPVELITRVARDVQSSKQNKSRLCIRFVPIETVCQATLENIKKTAHALCKQHFPAGESAEPLKFAVQYEHRASVKLQRGDVIDAVVEGVPQLIKNFCAMSVVSEFKKLGRFNLRELSMTGDDKAAAKAGSQQANGKDLDNEHTASELADPLEDAAEHAQDDSTQAAVIEGSLFSRSETPEVEGVQTLQQPAAKAHTNTTGVN